MERTVPETASEEIELYLRTYYSLLRASTEVKVRSLEEVHAGTNSLLHAGARQRAVDTSAFIYTLLRLPEEMREVELVVLGQSQELFAQKGIGKVSEWREVSAPARRRRCYFDGEKRLACLISSRSDIDDLVPILTAYQIEWNKLHHLLTQLPELSVIAEALNEGALEDLAELLMISADDVERLLTIWGDEFTTRLEDIASRRRNLRIQLLNGSLAEYRQAIHGWWAQIEEAWPNLRERPVYFISSNPHSTVNLLTGFALQRQEELLTFLGESKDGLLKDEWEKIQAEEVPSSRENYFYYLMKKYFQTPQGRKMKAARQSQERDLGIVRVASEQNFDIESQIIPLSEVDCERIDPRLRPYTGAFLEDSDAVVINIDYPLGMAAYHVLSEVADHVGEVLGVYIIGKAATLNGVVGDVMIPNVVYDGQSRNTYLFSNSFRSSDVTPYLVYGTVLDSQKAVTVLGTFLQNHEYMDVFYREGYTDIEMEAGPYLSAVCEMVRPNRYPVNEIVNLYELPFDVGMLHYASDKPLSKGRNLGAANLSYFGMDPTYATTLAALKRILEVEKKRMGEG